MQRLHFYIYMQYLIQSDKNSMVTLHYDECAFNLFSAVAEPLQPMLLQRKRFRGCCVIVAIILIGVALLLMSILLGVFCGMKHLCG